MKYRFLKWLIILILLPNLVFANAVKLSDVTVSTNDSNARIKFTLSEPTGYRIFTLPNPDRLVVDFINTQSAVDLKKITFSQDLVKEVRSGHPNATMLRLVFDLATPINYKALAQSQQVILDIYKRKPSKPLSMFESIKTAPLIPVKSASIKDTVKETIIVIDPGHGGKDPGASGLDGTKEKNVVLAIAKRLANLINKQPHMHAVLTRQGDYYVTLRQRLKLARKGKADLFMSIHADSYFNDRSTGASVYALSHRGATSEAARWLAQRDNYSELGGVDLGELGDKSTVLRSVLIDLAQTATITDSLRLGTAILDSLDRVTELHYKSVEQAPFMVLKSPDIPSVLVETGFISNPTEEEKLRDPTYQNKIAHALFNGIQLYLKKYSLAMYVPNSKIKSSIS